MHDVYHEYGAFFGDVSGPILLCLLPLYLLLADIGHTLSSKATSKPQGGTRFGEIKDISAEWDALS